MDAYSFADFIFDSSFGYERQEESSTRYFWDNANRGDAQFVIIQRTISGYGFFVHDETRHTVPLEHAFVAIVPEATSYGVHEGCSVPWVFSWVNAYGRGAIEMWTAIRNRYGPILPLAEGSAAGLAFASLVRDAEARRGDRLDRAMQSYGFALKMWQHMESLSQRHDAIATAARHFQTQYHDRVSLKELAERLGLSREHFSRAFRERYGVGPATFLRRRRLEAARDMLRLPNLPLGELALRCGFESVRHFSRAFQREEGLSPQAWRARL